MAAQKVLNKNQIRSVVSKYKKGASSRELAEEFGCHRSTIINVIPEDVRRPPGGSKPRSK